MNDNRIYFQKETNHSRWAVRSDGKLVVTDIVPVQKIWKQQQKSDTISINYHHTWSLFDILFIKTNLPCLVFVQIKAYTLPPSQLMWHLSYFELSISTVIPSIFSISKFTFKIRKCFWLHMFKRCNTSWDRGTTKQ